MTESELIALRGPDRLTSILKMKGLRQLDVTLDLSKDESGSVPIDVYGEILKWPRLDWIPLTDIDLKTLKVTYRIFGYHETLEAFVETFEYPAEFGHTTNFDASPLFSMYEIQLVVSSDFERRFIRLVSLRGLLPEYTGTLNKGHPIYTLRGPYMLLMVYFFNEYMAATDEEALNESVYLWTTQIPVPAEENVNGS
jgi:hypothetical protein